jgi:hypothetical protein
VASNDLGGGLDAVGWMMCKRSIALAVLATLVLLCTACGHDLPPPQPVLSAYEAATGRVIDRDCGYSVSLPGKTRRSLWLFCDTLVTDSRGKELGFPILGAGTAAEGTYSPGRAPRGLTEVSAPAADPPRPKSAAPTASRTPGYTGPQPFLPLPTDLTLPSSTLPCSGPRVFPARWITGAADEPGSSGHVLISYTDYCVSGRYVFTPEAFGLLDYDPASNTSGPPAQVFKAPAGQQLSQRQALGSPVFHGGYLYLFSSCGPDQGCGRGGVFLARTGAGSTWWRNGLTYRYWTGRGWSDDPAATARLLGNSASSAISVGDYGADGHGYVIVEQTSVNGDFTVWQAAAPTGPWQKIQTGRVPCTPGTQLDDGGLCRALIGHPELSSQGQLLISFFNPGAHHVEVSAYPW